MSGLCRVWSGVFETFTTIARGTLYPQKLTLTLPTTGGSSVGIVRLWTQASVFFFKYEQSSKYNFFYWNPILFAICMYTFRRFETRWGEILNLPNPSGRNRLRGLLSL
jgi:hypothetical protein